MRSGPLRAEGTRSRTLDAVVPAPVVHALVFAFFLLDCSKLVENLARQYGSPLRPFVLHGFLTAAMGVTAICGSYRLGWRAVVKASIDDAAYFAPLALLSVVIILGCGDFSVGGASALWPLCNAVIGISLCVFARFLSGVRPIVAAGTATLVIQLAALEADMWSPGVFGDLHGRAGGLPTNANGGALLIVLMIIMLLPRWLSEPPKPSLIYGTIAAVPAIAFTLSRSGFLLLAMLLLVVTVLVIRAGKRASPSPAAMRLFLAGLVAIVSVTILYGPLFQSPISRTAAETAPDSRAAAVERRSDELRDGSQSLARERLIERVDKLMGRAPDTAMEKRRAALSRFSTEALEGPVLGRGTGYVTAFQVGPHNMFLRMWVENGIPGLLVYVCLLAGMLVRAWTERSPLLMLLALVAWVASLVSHTLLVEPQLFVLYAAALGMVRATDQAT